MSDDIKDYARTLIQSVNDEEYDNADNAFQAAFMKALAPKLDASEKRVAEKKFGKK